MKQNRHILLFEKFLRNEASKDEIQELIVWLKDSPSSDEWLDEEWENTSSDMDEQLQKALYAKIEAQTTAQTPQRKSVKLTFPRVARWAAIFLMPIISGISVYLISEKRLVPEGDLKILVDKGQKVSAILPDGSKVWVNSASRLSYGNHYNEKDRILELEGEAYFEVKPDKKRPFIVRTKNFSVKALGTSFNVKSYNNETIQSALLVKGRVEVSTPFAATILNPNERIILNTKSKTMVKEVATDVNSTTCWMKNELSFDGETLESIVSTLERRYNVEIEFASESLKKYHFTGTIGNTNLQSILQILSFTSPITYEMNGTTIVLKEDKHEKIYFEKATK